MNWTWVDASKWAAAAAVIGAVAGMILSDAQADQVIAWGGVVEGIAVAVAGAAGALVMALRNRR